MRKISLIAAVDEHFGMGIDNHLLCHLPADLKYFKELTLGKPVIMGRKTYDSIGRPLPHRKNIVLTRSIDLLAEVEIAHSMQEALRLAGTENEIMVIGGESVYREFLPIATHIYLTMIHHCFEADVFFPTLDGFDWQCIKSESRPRDEKNRYDLTFVCYQKK
jgi:dihydrofolate reductase